MYFVITSIFQSASVYAVILTHSRSLCHLFLLWEQHICSWWNWLTRHQTQSGIAKTDYAVCCKNIFLPERCLICEGSFPAVPSFAQLNDTTEQPEYAVLRRRHSKNLPLPLICILREPWSIHWNLHFPFRLSNRPPRSLRWPILGKMWRICAGISLTGSAATLKRDRKSVV